MAGLFRVDLDLKEQWHMPQSYSSCTLVCWQNTKMSMSPKGVGVATSGSCTSSACNTASPAKQHRSDRMPPPPHKFSIQVLSMVNFDK